ncbi:hypothetical protein ACFWFX_05915, partial [Streptomyces roseolus]
SGAMAELAAKPGGVLALWVGVVAFSLMALWRLAEAVLGSSSRPDSGRVGDGYLTLTAFQAALTAVCSGEVAP